VKTILFLINTTAVEGGRSNVTYRLVVPGSGSSFTFSKHETRTGGTDVLRLPRDDFLILMFLSVHEIQLITLQSLTNISSRVPCLMIKASSFLTYHMCMQANERTHAHTHLLYQCPPIYVSSLTWSLHTVLGLPSGGYFNILTLHALVANFMHLFHTDLKSAH
jgi:hypothetical protein